MIDRSPANLYKMRLEALKHPTRPLRLDGSKAPYEDLVAWFIRERYGPWTESQMIKYQEAMSRIERNFDRVYKQRGIHG